MKKIAIVTGVTGQDGTYLSNLLLNKGYFVVGIIRSLDNLCFKNFDYLGISDRITFEEVDLLDKTSVFDLFHKYNPDEVYNLGAQSSVGLSFEQPNETFIYNTSSVNNLLESIRLYFPYTKFYQASSSEMYGNVSDLPVNLNSPMRPVSPYGISKMASHFMAISYRNSYNLYICCGVLFNHESYLRDDKFFVKKIIKSAILIKSGELEYLQLGNLNIKRDFGYAPNYVEAMWKMMQLNEPQDFLICSGKSIELKEIVEYVFKKVGVNLSNIKINEDLFRPNELYDMYGDNSDSKRILNWTYNFDFFYVLDILISEEILMTQRK
jgi:GDPmannose 4,6-dehydratase